MPVGLLASTDHVILGKWPSLFIAEVRKKDGTKYPPKTMYILLAGILRHMLLQNLACPNFLDMDDLSFAPFHIAFDNVLRDLRARGVSSESQQTEAFSKEEEECLWSSGTLGDDNSRSLLHAVFYLNGKNFLLTWRRRTEEFKISQLKRLNNPNRYVYTENSSKNRYGGVKQLHIKNKFVPIVTVPELGRKCNVFILDTYLQKLPPEAMQHDNFYVCSLPVFNTSKPWYTAKPIGRNTLASMVKEICAHGNIAGRKMNHSLHATGVSDLFHV